MRGAPPVHLNCTVCKAWLWAELVLHCLAAAVAAYWLTSQAGLPSRWPVVGAGLAAVVTWVVFARRATRRPVRELAWTGERWTLDAQPGAVALKMDLGRWLLLHFRADAGVREGVWLPLELSSSGRAVVLLRAALLAHAGQPSAPDAGRALSRHG